MVMSSGKPLTIIAAIHLVVLTALASCGPGDGRAVPPDDDPDAGPPSKLGLDACDGSAAAVPSGYPALGTYCPTHISRQWYNYLSGRAEPTRKSIRAVCG